MISTISNFNAFVDGRGYAGKVEEFTPPKLALATEDVRNGGMDTSVSVDVGMEPLEASMVMTDYDINILNLFGLVEGGNVSITLRAAMKDDEGEVTGIIYNMRGRITEIDTGSFKAGAIAKKTVAMKLNYLRITHGDTDVIEVDVLNCIRRANGSDSLSQIRSILGL